jgi:hypothetical protein
MAGRYSALSGGAIPTSIALRHRFESNTLFPFGGAL